MEKQFVKLAVEYWQLARLTHAMLHEIPAESRVPKGARVNFLARQFERLLAEYDLRLVDYTHQTYEANLPVLVMNKDELADMNTPLVVAQMHAPVVIQGGQVIEMGKVVLAPKVKAQ